MADREQALRDGVAAARKAPFAPAAPDAAPACARASAKSSRPKSPRQRQCRATARTWATRDARSQPLHDHQDLAGLIGHPRRAGGRERDQQQKQNDPVHRNPMAPVWRAPSWRRPRIDGMRPARRRAHRPCRSRVARRRDRPAPAYSVRAALRPNHCAAPPPWPARRWRRDRCRRHRCARSDQLRRAGLQAIDDAGARGGDFRRRRRQFRHQRQQLAAEAGGARHARGREAIERL